MPAAAAPAVLAADTFRSVHRRDPDGVWSAPGRVNLIGEHTDYNDGFVLPFALPNRIAAAASPRDDGKFATATLGHDGRLRRAGTVRIAELRPGSVLGWPAYVAGVAWALAARGHRRGAHLVLAGNVPTGAGLSSSAALECAVALALLDLNDASAAYDRTAIAALAHQAENEFVGAPTGVLDQTASLCCQAGHALFLDVRTGVGEQVPFDAAAAGLTVLVIDTRVGHDHVESGYAERRAGAAQAAARLGVRTLRDLTEADLAHASRALPAELAALTRHVVTENARVLATVECLRADGITEIGPLLDASHESLRHDYRVSCEELDLAVETARAAGALGARMTGGGFGGSAIALIPAAERPRIEHAVRSAFRRRGMRAPRMFDAVPSAGAGRDS